jgi:hypothetical protein
MDKDKIAICFFILIFVFGVSMVLYTVISDSVYIENRNKICQSHEYDEFDFVSDIETRPGYILCSKRIYDNNIVTGYEYKAVKVGD